MKKTSNLNDEIANILYEKYDSLMPHECIDALENLILEVQAEVWDEGAVKMKGEIIRLLENPSYVERPLVNPYRSKT